MPANEYFLRYFENFRRDGLIWRYLTLDKFQSLLRDQAIWFSRVDNFDDAFEGSLSEATWTVVRYPADMPPETIQRLKKVNQWQRQWTHITCWHYANYENSLMWAAYAPKPYSVAIRTTFAKLSSQIPDGVMLAPVMYKDFAREVVTDGTYTPYFQKRHFFNAEREVRGVFVNWPEIAQDADGGPENLRAGESISVDMNTMIDCVVTRPFATSEELARIEQLVAEAGLAIPVVSSQLSGVPYG